MLGGSLSCAVPVKGEGVYAPRRPFVNVTNVTQRNETIYYILHYDRSRSIVYNISRLKRPETSQKPTYTALFIRCRKKYLHICRKRPTRQIKILTKSRKTKYDAEAKPTQHAHNVRRHGKTTSENVMKRQREAHGKSTHRNTGECI